MGRRSRGHRRVRARRRARALGRRAPVVRLASVSKLVTGYAALVALEEGAIALDEPAGPPGATVHDLLSHSSGSSFDSDEVVAAPRTRRVYSNTGWERAVRTPRRGDGHAVAAVRRRGRHRATAAHVDDDAGVTGEGPLVVDGRPHPLRRPSSWLPHARRPRDDAARHDRAVRRPRRHAARRRARSAPTPGGSPSRSAATSRRTGRAGTTPRTFGHFGGSGTFLWVDPDARVGLAGLGIREFGPWALDLWPRFSDAVLARFADPDPDGPIGVIPRRPGTGSRARGAAGARRSPYGSSSPRVGPPQKNHTSPTTIMIRLSTKFQRSVPSRAASSMRRFSTHMRPVK